MNKWKIKKANNWSDDKMNEIMSDIKDILNHSTIQFDKIDVDYGHGNKLYIRVDYGFYTVARLNYGSYGGSTYELECHFPPLEFDVKDDNDIQNQFQILQGINKTLIELTQYLKMNNII